MACQFGHNIANMHQYAGGRKTLLCGIMCTFCQQGKTCAPLPIWFLLSCPWANTLDTRQNSGSGTVFATRGINAAEWNVHRSGALKLTFLQPYNCYSLQYLEAVKALKPKFKTYRCFFPLKGQQIYFQFNLNEWGGKGVLCPWLCLVNVGIALTIELNWVEKLWKLKTHTHKRT